MTSHPPTRTRRGLPARAALVAALAFAGLAATPALSHAASTITLYASATGSGTTCTASAPCSLTQAKTSVEAIDGNMSGNIVVQFAGGTYRLSAPLVFGDSDSGSNGYTVTWEAASGANPVISGGQQVTGWTLHDSANNIYSAPVPTGVDSRQLYVDGVLAPRASIAISRSDVSMTSTGTTIQNSALDYLATLPEQSRIELESQNSFTDRYAPVQSISGTTITMQQPAWDNNNWGYDTLASPCAGGQLYLENSYSFLATAGQWYLDPQAGELYYKAPSGWNPASHDVELPRLTSLLQISGSYPNPVHNISFQGLAFEHTTWLEPSTDVGYADQQSGTFLAQTYQQPANFLSSCQSGCQLFEATRNTWNEAPAAVQVSAASTIDFSGDTFTDLGEIGLGIGQDDDAVASGTGLGASGITADHNTFTADSGAGIVVGGVEPNAHHPSNADPGAVFDNNYIYDNQETVGLYLDEGSRYVTLSNNVVQDTGVWAFTNANANNNTDDNTFSNNWYNGGATNVATGSPHNNVLSNNVLVSGYNWPPGAQQVISQAGISGSSGGGGTGGSTGPLHAVGAGKCLDDPSSSTTGGTQQQIWDCNGQANQTWTSTSSNQLTLSVGGSTFCLDANAAGTSPGTKVIIWSCNGQANQQWTLNSNGTITGAQSGLCLDVTGASTADGALAELWTCNGGSNQQWSLG